MSDYHLDRFTILLVEDNGFIRQTVKDLLHYFKFKLVSTARNGEEAIQYLKDLKRAGNPGPDIIISDLLMSPIDGILFLRWVRGSKESPNRFAPFIMLSGAADRDYVNGARDLGVSEFLAKPFSAATVFSHIAQVIERPRPFIATQKYFGPDRRRGRSAGSPGTEERRREGDDFVTYVYSAEKTVTPKNVSDVWCFKLPNHLKEKAGGGSATGPMVLPDDIMADAEDRLERAALDFTEWAKEYLANLLKHCDDAAARPDARFTRFAEINELAHELRGQGGTFGYPLISTFGKMLYQSTLPGCPLTDNQVEIIRAHIDAMRAVIRDKVAGDGGQVGRDVLLSLKEAIKRHEVVE